MNFRIHDTTNRAHVNTCGWITRHPSYVDWLRESSGIFWIKGKPGSGKSTLMGFLLRDFQTQAVYKQSINLAFFLHGRGSKLQKSRLGMFRSLLHQLLLKAPEAGTAFQRSYEEKLHGQGEPGSNWEWHISEIFGFLVSALQYVLKGQSVSIFVDALDEADDGTTDRDTSWQIVEDFHKLNEALYRPGLRLKICFSCRHFPVISCIPRWEVWLEKENYEDISKYIHDKLKGDLFSTKPENRDFSEWENTIITKAQGVFQWAALVVGMVVRYHAEGKRSKIRKMLKNVPKGLSEVYKHILENLIEMEDGSQTLRLLRWVYFAEHPLTIPQLCFAMCVPERETFDSDITLGDLDLPTHEEMRRQVVVLSGGLVELNGYEDNQILQFIHQSVKDYLLEDGLKALDKVTGDNISGFGHHQLSLICANFLGIIAGRLKHLSTEAIIAQFPFTDYVIGRWSLHAEKAEDHGVSQDYLLRFHQRYMNMADYWPEFYFFFGAHRNYKYCAPCPLTMLHFASAANLSTVVIGLLEIDHQAEYVDEDNQTALHHASRFGHSRIVEILLDAKAEIEAEDFRGYTPLGVAVINGHQKTVEMLCLRGANVNKFVANNGTPLYEAAHAGYANVVQILLDNKADPNARGGDLGTTALLVAIKEGHERIVQLLLDNKADTKYQTGFSRDALRTAVRHNNIPIVQMLLKNGADVNIQGGHYGNALQTAAFMGSASVLKLLLGAENQLTILHPNFAFSEIVKTQDISLKAKFLLDRAKEIYIFHRNIKEEREDAVRVALDRGMNTDVPGGSEGYAIHTAAFLGNMNIVSLLVERSSNDVHLRDRYGRTASQIVAQSGGKVEIMEYLLKHGADPCHSDRLQTYPLDTLPTQWVGAPIDGL
jgi:ankyrin repeat protein